MATSRMPLLAQLGDPAGGARREERDAQRADAHQHSGDDVDRVMLAAVDPRGDHDQREQGADAPDGDSHPNVLEVSSEKQCQRAIDRDGGGNVAGRIAVGQVERVHLLDGRPRASHEVDDERVAEDLGERRLKDEAGHPPTSAQDEEDPDNPDERDQHVAVRQIRGDV